MLKADREADETVRDSGGLPRFRRHRRVGHRRRRADEAFKTAERFSDGEYVEPAQQAEDVDAVGEFNAQHRAEALLLTARDLVTGVPGKTRIIDPRDALIRCERVGDEARGFLLAFDARENRPKPPQGEKRI